jgi:hypothetical protein
VAAPYAGRLLNPSNEIDVRVNHVRIVLTRAAVSEPASPVSPAGARR